MLLWRIGIFKAQMGYNIKKYTIKLGRKNSAQPLKHSPFAGPHLEDLHLLFTLLLAP